MLENRIPPPVVGLLFAGLMGLAAAPLPGPGVAKEMRVMAAGSALLIGLAVILAGVLSFRRARTTVDPLRPRRASSLVVTGIFRFSRNPMYLGMALLLTAWAAYLGNPLLLIGVAAFVLYMNRFQIAPEERAMEQLFGEAFETYRRRVRRWI